MRDIQLVAQYVGLSLLSKGLSVSPLKLQKYSITCKHGIWFFSGESTHCFQKYHKLGSMDRSIRRSTVSIVVVCPGCATICKLQTFVEKKIHLLP